MLSFMLKCNTPSVITLCSKQSLSIEKIATEGDEELQNSYLSL